MMTTSLSCFVTPSGKRLALRYQWLGREKMLSMGELPATSLALARKKRDDARGGTELAAMG